MAGNSHGFCAWCFDLLMIDGKDVRGEPLDDRRDRLEHLLSGADADLLRFSEAFDQPVQLLEAAINLGLEGIVSKKRDQPYVSGRNSGWVKCKTAVWRQANRDRWENRCIRIGSRRRGSIFCYPADRRPKGSALASMTFERDLSARIEWSTRNAPNLSIGSGREIKNPCTKSTSPVLFKSSRRSSSSTPSTRIA
jgi:hypothetical protein